MPPQTCGSSLQQTYKKARIKKNTTTVTKLEPGIFKWMMKHQVAFDALKEVLSTATVLG